MPITWTHWRIMLEVVTFPVAVINWQRVQLKRSRYCFSGVCVGMWVSVYVSVRTNTEKLLIRN